jgi:hypothetical protein
MSNPEIDAIRLLIVSHDVADPWVLATKLLDVIEHQQEQINNLREAAVQQAEKLAGQTAALGRKIQKLEGVHGA